MTRDSRPTSSELAEFADVVLDLARRLDIRNPELRDVVPLTGTEIVVIREIHRRPGLSPSDIAAVTGLQRSNVSTAIRSLQAGGLVVRERASDNARTVRLMPTDLASKNVARIHAYWASVLERVPGEILAAGVAASPALARITSSLHDH